MSNTNKQFAFLALAISALLSAAFANAEEPRKPTTDLREPVYRVTKQEPKVALTDTTTAPASIVAPPNKVAPPKTHPLDEPLRLAQQALEKSRKDYRDYTAILVKRERVGGRLYDEQYMFAKIRNRKVNSAGQVATPFSFYLKFLKPSSVKGREVIYVEGQNNGKLVAHEGGFKGKFTPSLYLDPNGTLAMMGQRYPATEIGIERMCEKLIARASHDRTLGDCQVTTQPAKINKRPATRVEVVHPNRKPKLDFHMARVFVDNEYGVPVRYEAYDWPRTPGAPVSENELIEEYTYVRLEFNVGLSDADFDPANKAYNMK